MNLTPIDVEQKAFTQALRGYQMDEVDDFLDEVVGALRNYEQRLREAHDKIRVLETEGTPANRGGDESEISRAILTAQRSADRLLAEARAEAETVRGDAAAETSRLAAHRDSERNRLQTEVTGMAELVSSLRTSLATLSAAVGSQMDEMDTEIETANAGLVDESSDLADQGVADEELLEDFDSMTSEDEVDEQAEPPTFSDIFPEADAEEQDTKSRVTSRPWERG